MYAIPVLLTLQQYKDQCIHVDNWCGASPANNDNGMLNGLSLDTDSTWSIQANLGVVPNDAAAAPNTIYYGLKCYLFFTTQKKLVISRGSLTVV